MIGMAPEQHAARARELVAEAEGLYSDYRLAVENNEAVDTTIRDFIDTTIRLGQLHAACAMLPSAGPSFTPTHDTIPGSDL